MRGRLHILVRMSLLFGLVFAIASPLWGQSEARTGTLNGIISDPSGAVIPKATVTVKHTATGYTRSTMSGADGFYTLPLLPVGTYELRIEAQGFATLVQTNLPVDVGRVLTLSLQMKVGATQQTVEVTSEAPLVSTAQTQVSAVVGDRAVRDLPVHGRNFLEFALLTPGVVRDNNRGGDISFGALKGTLNSLEIDGVENNNNFFGQSLGRTGVRAPFQFSVEAVQEFQVKTNSYSAEFGRAGGAVINAVTKSGTNGLHGSLYDFFRDNRLNANKWEFNRAGRARPPLRIWQFGGVAGGPIVKNKAFWFFDYDSQRRKVPNPIICPFPPTNPLASACTAAKADAIVGPRIQDYSATLNQDVFLWKVDWHVRPRHDLSVRYNYQRFTGGSQENGGPTSVREHTGDSLVHTHTLSGSLVSTVRPNLLNELRLQWARDAEPGQANSSDPEAFLQAGGTTFLSIGRNDFSPRNTTINLVQLVNNVSYLRGKHSFKFGGDFDIQRILNFFPGNFSGSYLFTSFANFPNKPLFYTQAFAGAGTSGATTHPDITDYSWFVQDEFRASQELTLSLGLRYDLQTNHKPSIVNHDPQLSALGINTGQMNTDSNNFGPRIGFAWAPRWNHPVVIRGGYGIYYGTTPSIMTATATSNNALQIITITLPGNSLLLPSGFAYPSVLSAIPTGATPATPNLYVFAPGYVQPLVHQGSIGAEYQVTNDWSISASYLFVKGVHLSRSNDVNLFDPVLTNIPISTGGFLAVERFLSTRPASNYRRITEFQSNARSRYDALTVSATKRFSHHVLTTASYTYSTAFDDVPDFTAVVFGVDDSKLASNPRNLREDFGASDQDFRHRFVAYSVWNLDYLDHHPNFAIRNGLGRWSFSGIFQAQNGRHWSTRLGGDPDNDSNVAVDRAFGVPRNSNQLPAQVGLDTRLEHDFPVTERMRFQFFFEAFNLFNRPNFSGVNQFQYSFSTASATLAPVPAFRTFTGTYDQPTSGTNFPGPGPRTLQLGLKFVW